MTHRRIRPFNTRDVYPGGRHDNDMCMAVRAGNRVFLRGQTGLDLDQRLLDPHDAGAQAAQAMENVKRLLGEAGAGMQDICKLIIYITDRAYRNPVYQAMAPHLEGCAPARTGLVVKGLALPELKMEVDVEAVVPDPGNPHRHIRTFDLGGWKGEPLDGRVSHAVVAGDEIFLTGQIGTPPGSGQLAMTGHTPEAAAAQAEQAMRNVAELLDEAGASMGDVCKMRVYLGDRAYREAVYQVLGRHLGDAHPCSTGLVVSGFAWPEILFEIDVAAVRRSTGSATLIRPYETAAWYRDGQDLRCRFAMAKRVGQRVYLRGQTGHDIDGRFHGVDDPAEQAHQAMRNVAQLLAEAGASMRDVCQITTYISDRGYRERVYRAIGEHVRGIHPVGTGLIVNGFASPEICVEVDVEAVIP
jgi:enamine deaminase RidA (YjgF/YER057c/UK114 family)